MDIYLIRHGETDWNKVKRLQGVTDIPLNAYGIELAEKTAEGLKDIPFDIIYTSPLIRAKRTAEIIRRDRDIEIIPTEGLRELCFGKYEGFAYLTDEDEESKAVIQKFFKEPDKYVAPPDGESIEHLRKRTSGFVRSIMNDPELADKTILMTAHGAAIRGILSGLQNLPIADFWSGPVHSNCGVTKLHAEHGEFIIEFENKVYY